MNRRAVRHDLRFVLLQNLWILVPGLTLLLLLIPFSTAGLSGSSIFNIEVTHQQMKFRLFHDQVIPWIPAALIGLGGLTGFSLFHFVLDKKESTIWFSLGIRRSGLFLNRLLAGALLLFIMVALPMALSCLLNLQALGNYQGLICNTVYLALLMFLQAMFSLLLSAWAILGAGTLTEACTFWAGLMTLPTVLCYGTNLLLKQLFWGNPWGAVTYSGTDSIRESLLSVFSKLNPLLFLQKPLQTNGSFIRPLNTAIPDGVDWSVAVLWLSICIAAGAVAVLLMQARRAEKSGMSGGSRLLAELIMFSSGYLVFDAVFSLLNTYGTIPALLLAFLALTAVQLFWRLTLFRSLQSGRTALPALAGQAILLLSACLVCAFGMPGSTQHLLDSGTIAEAEVSYVGAPSFLYEEVAGSSTGRGYYVTGSLRLTSAEAVAQVIQIHRSFLKSGRMAFGNGDETAETVVPYDIRFLYTDTDGNEHICYYDRASYSQLEALLGLEDLTEVRQAQADLLTGENPNGSLAGWAWQAESIYLTDALLYNTYELSMSDEQRIQLMQAVAEDLSGLTTEQLYFPDSQAEAVLLFTNVGEQDSSWFTYHLDNAYLYLTDDFWHTLSWLEENGLLELVSEQPEAEYVLLQTFDPYIGINGLTYPMGMYFMGYCADTEDEFIIQQDFGNRYSVSDPEEVEQLLDCLQPGCYMTQGGYLAAVRLKGEEKLRYLFLPTSQIPDFMTRN